MEGGAAMAGAVGAGSAPAQVAQVAGSRRQQCGCGRREPRRRSRRRAGDRRRAHHGRRMTRHPAALGFVGPGPLLDGGDQAGPSSPGTWNTAAGSVASPAVAAS